MPRSTRSIRGRGSSGASTTSPPTARFRSPNWGRPTARPSALLRRSTARSTMPPTAAAATARSCASASRSTASASSDVFTQYNPDVIVSVHPLLNHAALRARADAGMDHVPIVTVITDLGRVHEGWLLPEADLTIVPAREVYKRAIERGVPPSRLRLIGHPIHPKFEDVSATKSEIRNKLGLPQEQTDRAPHGGRRRRRQTAAHDARAGQDAPAVPPGRRHRPQRGPQGQARRARAFAAHVDDRARASATTCPS